MANHPNRNWRARMIASCAQFVAGFRAVHRVPPEAEPLLSAAYRAGYADGRESKCPKPR